MGTLHPNPQPLKWETTRVYVGDPTPLLGSWVTCLPLSLHFQLSQGLTMTPEQEGKERPSVGSDHT